MATSIKEIKVCGSCTSAMKEEMRESGIPLKDAKRMAINMGGDIPDHNCTLRQKGL